MKGTEAKLISYMQGADKRFVIPVYQRNYDWRIENCRQLYDDLVKIIQKGRRSHFFGSIVSVHNDSTFNEFLIIDGQQRITTISLLMLAMYNIMKAGILVPEQSILPDKIYKTYLIDEWQEDETRIKLKPVKNDSAAFGKLFGGDEDEYIRDSNLTINYQYFYQRILKEEISLDQLYTAITRLEIINITLSGDDNPQLIFESLNSTGLALSEGDKIRNFILMGLPTREQNDYYEKYWNRIEQCTGYNVSAFVRDYLSVKQQAIPAMNKVYATFKMYVEDEGLETEPLLKDLLFYARQYSLLLKPSSSVDRALRACIVRLNRLETTITRPFFLEVLRLQEEGRLTREETREIFLYTENYLFRRTICDLPTNALNKIFLMLHREIIRYDGTADNYVEKFKYALLSKNERGRFPRDNEFVEAFSARQVYQMNSKNKIYIFERFENAGVGVEDKDIYSRCDEGIYTIEHIMPQHLTPAWNRELGDRYEEIHETWLHRLANLTLTGYNSKYSNNTFEEKKTMQNGFEQSGLRINIWIAQQKNWGISELGKRNEMLMKQALGIWPLPETAYVPSEKQLDVCTLDDDIDLSGRQILRFEYKKTVQPVTSWINMMEQVIKILHAEDKSILYSLARSRSSDSEIGGQVSDRPDGVMNPLEIDDGIYLEKHSNTGTKIVTLKKLFRMYGANPEDLFFYLKNDEDDMSDKEKGPRFEIRKKYWTFALDYIHEANKENGSFANVNSSKENWISGYFGIGGFNIACIANYDQARIDLTLSKYSKEENKSAFDFLYGRKTDIERRLGMQVEWIRSEDTKASYVSYRMNGVSIINETDWIMMSKFHAEWSRKFYDVFVPLLKEWNETR